MSETQSPTIGRRTFLLASAALPVAAAMPAIAAPAIEPVAAAVVAPIAAAAYPWKWWVSLDGGELFQSQFDTREEALAEAKDYGPGAMIAECRQQDFRTDIGADRILEWLHEANEDLMGEDSDYIDCTPEQERDLEKSIEQVVADWVRRHKIDNTAWVFGATRNEFKIEAPSAKGGSDV